MALQPQLLLTDAFQADLPKDSNHKIYLSMLIITSRINFSSWLHQGRSHARTMGREVKGYLYRQWLVHSHFHVHA